MDLIFYGSGEFGLPTFKALAQQHRVLCVVTQPDKPAGRKRVLTATPVGEWAAGLGVPVFKDESVNTPVFLEKLAGFKPDASVVIAFGQKLSPQVIEGSGALVVNLHASILPRFRGAAPINHAILSGDKETGVSVISLAQRMDAGLVYATRKTAIGELETSGELHDRLSLLGPEAVGQVLADFAAGTLKGQAQDESKATRAPKFTKEDSLLKFDLPAGEVKSRVHGLTPWPGARTTWHGAKGPVEVIIHRAKVDSEGLKHGKPVGSFVAPGVVACRTGYLVLLELQVPGSKVAGLKDFLNGHAIQAGDTLG